MRTFLQSVCALILTAIVTTADAAAPAATPPPLDPALPRYTPSGRVSGTLQGITGMDSVEGMFRAWSEAFAKYHPEASLSLVQQDVAPEERIALGPNTAEVFHPDDAAYEARYGYGPFRIKICQGAFVMKSHVSAIGVFVSKANPLSQISLDELDALYTDARRRGYPADITTWGELGLGGEWADRSPGPYLRFLRA